MAICQNRHRYWRYLATLPDDQGGVGRHKCCGCAYEQGYNAGFARSEHISVNLDSLHQSQAGAVRHKSPHAAYAQGYKDGISASYNQSSLAS
ncbi:hypothetical protein [Yersinia similis]|uniref:Uncharacterized protein n=1 Tax=Yersinia similis TaxID=367190 RepID=A0A0T9RS88_9GAMM|nr:hypothetical protein [Yersinia similis]CNF58296.1 Uncharacterised protein [Yersinia similis]CNI78842.1 Uncharacterised protein [Yersinia similis]